MKIVVVALLAIAVKERGVYADLLSMEANYNKCLAENGITEGEANELKLNKDPKFQCVHACTLDKEGALKNSKVNKDALLEILLRDTVDKSEEDVIIMLDSCLKIVQDIPDMCVRNNDLIDCLAELWETDNSDKFSEISESGESKVSDVSGELDESVESGQLDESDESAESIDKPCGL